MSRRTKPQQRRLPVRTIMVGGFLLLCVGVLVWSMLPRGSGGVSGGTNVNDPAVLARGQQIYAAQCASCHGANLEGQPNWQAPLPTGGRLAPPHDETGHTWHHDDEYLFTITKYGGQAVSPPDYQNNMPAFSQLSDADIWAVLSYIKSRWPPEIQAAQSQRS